MQTANEYRRFSYKRETNSIIANTDSIVAVAPAEFGHTAQLTQSGSFFYLQDDVLDAVQH